MGIPADNAFCSPDDELPLQQSPECVPAWSAPQVKSPELQELLTESLNFLNQTIPKIFRATSNISYLIYTDASNLGWGASLKTWGKEIKSAGLMWTAKQRLRDFCTAPTKRP